ncbi:MAG: putative multidrug efflux pump, rane protein [Pseudobdellovibrio sp.]|nr:putative multidrug efflux pump, rane protein [Pseudobdellovibrio sp.]
MGRLIDLFIEKSKWGKLITIFITIAGLAALFSMKKDLHPPFKFNNVVVSLAYPNASADEIERLITYPLEEQLRDISDVKEINSKTRVGFVSITLKFPQSVKRINDKIEEIRGKIQPVIRLLPSTIRDVQVQQAGSTNIFLAEMGITGIDPQSMEHHAFVDSYIAKMKSVPGISDVESTLMPFHIFVKFDREKLLKKNVSIPQLQKAIRGELSGNTITHNSISGKSWLLEFADKPVDLNRIKNIEIFNNGSGGKTRVSDVADVVFEPLKNEKFQFLFNGAPAVNLTVFKTESSDSIKTFEDLKKALAEIKTPAGVEHRVLYDGPYFIQQQLDVLVHNGFGGLILVMLVLTLAMGWRSSLMTALGLPISYFGTFLILKAFGISIDLISLMAMILVVGNLVDDAVIFSDRYNQLLSEGLDPSTAASQSAKEMVVPVSGTLLTVVFAFLPIVIIDSELSVIFFALPIVIGSALFLSWFDTFFILPNHLKHFVKQPTAEKSTAFFHWLAGYYKIALRHTLRFRYAYGLASIALLAFSVYTASKMPQNFNLSINAPQVELAITFKNENSFSRIIEILKPLHTEIRKLPSNELDFIETNLGWVYRDGKASRGPRFATVRLVLDKHEVDTKKLRQSVETQVKQILENYKPAEIEELVLLSNERGSGDRRMNLSTIEIQGKDIESFSTVREEIIALVKGSGKKLEYAKPDQDGPETFRFILDDKKIAGFGLSRDSVGTEIRAMTGYTEVAETRSENRWMNIYMEPKSYEVPSLAGLSKIQIQPFQEGQRIALSQLGEWVPVGFSEPIEHKGGARILKMDFRFDGKETNEQVIKKELRDIIAPVVAKHSNLKIGVIDSNEQDKKGREWGMKVLIMAGVAIYLILAFTMGSFVQPLIVGLPIPFSIIGVIWALKFHGMQLGLMVMLGLVGTMGVAVNDSIVMCHQINLLWKKYGIKSSELIIEGAASRIRAMVLTAGCTLIGVFPTAYGLGGESGFTQPLAFSMGWGLSTAVLLTLFVIPAMLMILNDIGGLINRFKAKRPLIRRSEVSQKEPVLDLQS